MLTDLLLEAFAFEPISQRFTKNYAVDVTDSARIIEIALLGHTKETVDVSIGLFFFVLNVNDNEQTKKISILCS